MGVFFFAFFCLTHFLLRSLKWRDRSVGMVWPRWFGQTSNWSWPQELIEVVDLCQHRLEMICMCVLYIIYMYVCHVLCIYVCMYCIYMYIYYVHMYVYIYIYTRWHVTYIYSTISLGDLDSSLHPWKSDKIQIVVQGLFWIDDAIW